MSATGRKVVANYDKEEDNLQDTASNRSSEVNKETRKRERAEENATIMEHRAREIKGKMVAKEERMEDVYEICDDTKEEEDMQEPGREDGDQ